METVKMLEFEKFKFQSFEFDQFCVKQIQKVNIISNSNILSGKISNLNHSMIYNFKFKAFEIEQLRIRQFEIRIISILNIETSIFKKNLNR